MPPHTTIVLPAFNEEEALPVVVADIRSVLGPDADILVVDDGSSDGTVAAARQLGCAVEVHTTNRGNHPGRLSKGVTVVVTSMTTQPSAR